MKICAVICEYNPFHNGHLYQLEQIKKICDCDTILLVMSGNFTQRGECACLDKFTRAKHGILGGADIVIELPVIFSTAPAEIFAYASIKMLNSIKDVKYLVFGAENPNKEKFISTAKAFNDESKEFKLLLKQKLKEGVSLAKARYETIKELNKDNVDFTLLESSNNILGIEYTKAILKLNANIEIIPIKRIGSNFNDLETKNNFSSATSIRNAIKLGSKKIIKKNIPKYVYNDILYRQNNIEELTFYSLITRSSNEISQILDCTEGLENRIKALIKDCDNLEDLIKKVTTKRYTSSRISRICTSNLLNINENLVRNTLKGNLYLKILAIKKDRMDILSNLKENCIFPLITRKSDTKLLFKQQLECLDKDIEANDIYNFSNKTKINHFNMQII